MKIKALVNIGTDLLASPLLENEQREVSAEIGSRCVALNAAVEVIEPKPAPPAAMIDPPVFTLPKAKGKK